MNIERPPKQCRLICYGMAYNDETEVMPNHILEWRGEISRRANPEKDDLWKLYAPDKRWVWSTVSDIEILGRTPGNHTLQEWIDSGKDLFD